LRAPIIPENHAGVRVLLDCPKTQKIRNCSLIKRDERPLFATAGIQNFFITGAQKASPCQSARCVASMVDLFFFKAAMAA
jgi:hypothetical protein